MQYNTLEFIFIFLPLSVILYFYINHRKSAKGGIWVLILLSLFFYAYAGFQLLPPLFLSLGVNYAISLLIKKSENRKPFLVAGICFNIGLLLYFKYLNFFIGNFNVLFGMDTALKKLVLPLGISFFTFQQISYIVSVYRESLPYYGFAPYLCYILYFPKLIMGPLIEPADFYTQLSDAGRKSPDFDSISSGVWLFGVGLFKKVVIADVFAPAVNWVFGNYLSVSSLDLLLAILLYTFQIYFDFSGYSDMAVGISKLFNIDLPQNFNSPYKALSIRDFWKRWHMSLTRFLTKYIYIPLGGSRKGTARTYLNTLIVFLISGFWHGASWTFIIWGALNGIICVLERHGEKFLVKIPKWLRYIFTFIIINLLWLIFRCESMEQFFYIIRSLFSGAYTGISGDFADFLYINGFNTALSFLPDYEYAAALLSGLVRTLLSLFIVFFCKNSFDYKHKYNFASALFLVIIFLWAVCSLSGETVFIYNGF